MRFDVRRDRARVAAYLCATYGVLIRLRPPISRADEYSDVAYAPSHAVDYIDACAKKNAICRFFRALSAQLCYAFFALNTSVVLCGLW
jgi:hypothetical protein